MRIITLENGKQKALEQEIAKENLGIDKVSNTSDEEKVSSGPISEALAEKVDMSLLLDTVLLNQNKLGEEL